MVGWSPKQKNEARCFKGPVLKEAYLRLQIGAEKPRLEFASSLLGKLFQLQRVQRPYKKKKIFQLNADECVPEVLTPADLLDMVPVGRGSTIPCTHDLSESKDRLIGTAKDTVQRHTAMSQDQFKKAPKYFQHDRSVHFMVPFKKQIKILKILPLSLA